MIEFMGKDSEGDDCIHLQFSNGAIVSYSTYQRSILTWWVDSLDEIIPPQLNVGADKFVSTCQSVRFMHPRRTIN